MSQLTWSFEPSKYLRYRSLFRRSCALALWSATIIKVSVTSALVAPVSKTARNRSSTESSLCRRDATASMSMAFVFLSSTPSSSQRSEKSWNARPISGKCRTNQGVFVVIILGPPLMAQSLQHRSGDRNRCRPESGNTTARHWCPRGESVLVCSRYL